MNNCKIPCHICNDGNCYLNTNSLLAELKLVQKTIAKLDTELKMYQDKNQQLAKELNHVFTR